MLYIFNQAILVELKQINNHEYLIGNQIYNNVPESIIESSLNSANWNRAIKFKTIENEIFISSKYFMLKMEIYYDYNNKQLVYLSKNQFHQKIIQQEYFKKAFVKQIYDFRNRNKLMFAKKNINKLDFNKNNYEIIDSIDIDLNRCFVNNDFQIKKQKYKVLFKLANEYKIESNSNGQTIYSINYSDNLVTLIDSKTKKIYIQGKFDIEQNDICLDISYEDYILTNKLINNLMAWIKNNIDKEKINWHLFNITKEYKYLIYEIEQLVKAKRNYFELKIYLTKTFNELKINFNNTMYSSQDIKNLLISISNTKEELEELEKDIKRYGILNSLDQKNISKKR